MASRRSSDTPRPPATVPTLKPAPARPARSRKPDTLTLRAAPLSASARHAMIAESAYLRAERRGFTPGHETEDWLAAEAEVDALLRVSHGGSPQ